MSFRCVRAQQPGNRSWLISVVGCGALLAFLLELAPSKQQEGGKPSMWLRTSKASVRTGFPLKSQTHSMAGRKILPLEKKQLNGSSTYQWLIGHLMEQWEPQIKYKCYISLIQFQQRKVLRKRSLTRRRATNQKRFKQNFSPYQLLSSCHAIKLLFKAFKSDLFLRTQVSV